MTRRFDIIGDIHGELPALLALGRELGYDGDWSHPEGRIPVFLGDLVDRGAHSLEVGELVKRLVDERRGFCVMGNHEYNLVAWAGRLPGYEKPKKSNRPTTEAIARDPRRWRPVLDFLRTLPLAIALPDLRIIHACWHAPSLAQVDAVLGQRVAPAGADDAVGWLERHVALRSPFDGAAEGSARLVPGLPEAEDPRDDAPHEQLMKGFEVDAPEPFTDNDGKTRDRIRAVWWNGHRDRVLTDRPQVFGHYWNLPPVDGQMAPPQPSGTPMLRDWGRARVDRVPDAGRTSMTGDLACIDFQGVTNAPGDRACIGALRWPERELAWACGTKTSRGGEGD